MAGAVRQTNRALKEISGELEANRVLKLPAPDREMEELLVTINDALRKIREQHLEYAKESRNSRDRLKISAMTCARHLTSMIGYLDIMDKTAPGPGGPGGTGGGKTKSPLSAAACGPVL
mgnify:CR=1 FL=1